MPEQKESMHFVLNAEPGKYEVTINLVTQVSTTANASFDKYVTIFTKRISDKAAEILGTERIPSSIPKSE